MACLGQKSPSNDSPKNMGQKSRFARDQKPVLQIVHYKKSFMWLNSTSMSLLDFRVVVCFYKNKLFTMHEQYKQIQL